MLRQPWSYETCPPEDNNERGARGKTLLLVIIIANAVTMCLYSIYVSDAQSLDLLLVIKVFEGRSIKSK